MLNRAASITRSSILDADAFADLYREHLAAVFNYCLFRIGERAVAEDLTAETFERAWRARRRYRPERAAFNTWLFTISRRVVSNWMRGRSRRRMVQLDERLADTAPLPESRLEEAERKAQLRDLIRTLNDREQELIALKFGAGMSNRQIAQLMGKSETAIGSALYRVMAKLRQKWENTK